MGDYQTMRSTSPLGQVVEYRQYPGGGYSLAESPAKVVVSGRTVVSGWSSDGTTYDAYQRAVRYGWTDEPTGKHVCRKRGRAMTALEGPAWAAPGELVKLADEDNWGRVELLWRCCGTYDVRVEAFGDQEAGLLALPPEALENAYDTYYPFNLPPKGYPVPKRH